MRSISRCANLLVAVVLATWALPVAYAGEAKIHAVRVYEGQLSKARIDGPSADSVVRVVNHAQTDSDVDLIAVDSTGKDVGRETVVVPRAEKRSFRLREVFPKTDFDDVRTVTIQATARPVQPDGKVDGLLAVAFFSQHDARWSGNQLGGCSDTIGNSGCAISSIAMAGARSVYNFQPASLNDYLRNNGGYQGGGCNVIWSAPANFDGAGGFTSMGQGNFYNATDLKAVIDANQFAVAQSFRFSPTYTHFVVIIGYNGSGTNLADFVYLDPWDPSAVYRHVLDFGWVTTSSVIHKYL